jgi:hypothetical protein
LEVVDEPVVNGSLYALRMVRGAAFVPTVLAVVFVSLVVAAWCCFSGCCGLLFCAYSSEFCV